MRRTEGALDRSMTMTLQPHPRCDKHHCLPLERQAGVTGSAASHETARSLPLTVGANLGDFAQTYNGADRSIVGVQGRRGREPASTFLRRPEVAYGAGENRSTGRDSLFREASPIAY